MTVRGELGSICRKKYLNTRHRWGWLQTDPKCIGEIRVLAVAEGDALSIGRSAQGRVTLGRIHSSNDTTSRTHAGYKWINLSSVLPLLTYPSSIMIGLTSRFKLSQK
jgi:hypothetical protein